MLPQLSSASNHVLKTLLGEMPGSPYTLVNEKCLDDLTFLRNFLTKFEIELTLING